MDNKTMKEKIKFEIDEIFAEVDKLEAKKEYVKAISKAEYELKLAELKLKKLELKAKYDEVVNSPAEKLEEMKAAFDKSATHFKQGFKELGALLK